MKKSAVSVIQQEAPDELEIPDIVPIDGRLKVNTVVLQVHEYEAQAPEKEGSASNTIVPVVDEIIEPHVSPTSPEVVKS